MRFLAIAFAALPLAAATAEPAQPPERGWTPEPIRSIKPAPEKLCPEQLVHKGAPPEAEMKKLTELPPADAYHAVYRLGADGCLDPVLVGYQYRQER